MIIHTQLFQLWELDICEDRVFVQVVEMVPVIVLVSLCAQVKLRFEQDRH